MPLQQELSLIIPEIAHVNAEIKKTVEEELLSHYQPSQPFLLDGQGKKLRPALFLASAKTHGDDVSELIPLAASLELIHMATLLHDDVVDRAALRRNLPTVNSSEGNIIAVLLGDYLFSKAFSLLTSAGNLEIIQLFSRVVERMSLGELKQQTDAFNLFLAEEEYLDRINQKTAEFMASCSLAGCLTSECPEDLQISLYHFGLNLGMAFQIIDDVIDFKDLNSRTGKDHFNDLKNGVMTLPLIYVLQSPSNKELMIKWMSNNRMDEDSIANLLDQIKINRGLAYALSRAEQYLNQARCFAGQVPSKEAQQNLQLILQLIWSRVEE